MSRISRRVDTREGAVEGIPVMVATDSRSHPVSVNGLPVLQRLSYFREWIGILDGELQRDVWRVETACGICELHYLCFPEGDTDSAPGSWLLIRWED